MKIVFVSPEYPTLRSGGIGTFHQTIARHLASRGHKVTVLVPGDSPDFWDENVRVRFIRRAGVPRLGWLCNRLRLQYILKQMSANGEIDVVESPDWCGLTAGVKAGVPVLVRCHGSDSYFAALLRTRPRLRTYLEERLAVRGADSVAAVSDVCAKVTRRIFSLKDFPRVIYNGVDTSYFSPSPHVPRDAKKVLLVGTLVHKKGAADYPKFINKICLANAEVSVHIIGRDTNDSERYGGSVWKWIEQRLDPSIMNRVVFHGELSASDVRLHMQSAGVCVFLSHAEAFPISWLEAMSCGCAVVCYEGGWAREMIEEGETGFIVNQGDIQAAAQRVQSLVSSNYFCQQIGMQARERLLDRFSIERCAEDSLCWYEAVLRGERV